MLDLIGSWKRTKYCGDVDKDDVGNEVILMGWVQSNRDHGGVIFIDLRDREGICQVVFNPEHNTETHKIAESVKDEWVIAVRGTVSNRTEETVNPNIKTGNFELITKISRREAFRKNKKTLRITGGLSKIHTIRTK